MKIVKTPRAATLMPILMLTALATAGCGSDLPQTYDVTGEVTYQGAPVEGAQVMFMPKNSRQATGTTDAAGKFVLTTYENGDGAVLGEHEVTIAKMVQVNPNDTSSYPEMRPALPPKYNLPQTSGLKAVVEDDGENHFTFQLTN